MSMNGTGGVWRVRALRDAGGWSAATLTEDLDLSYRALLRGWDFLMLPDFGVFGELPPAIQAYKLQQRRWAIGMTQNLRRHARALLGARRYSPAAKIMGLMHLSQYAVQPLLLLMFLLTPVLLASDLFARLPNLSPLGISGIIPLLVMITGQRALHADWPHRLLALPVQGVIGAGMALNNTIGVLAALGPWRASREFLRTPKFGGEGGGRAWQSSRYALSPDWITLGELVLGAYALLGTALALRTLPALAPYLLTYAAGFWGIAGWNLAQAWSRLARSPDLSAEDAEARPA